VNGGCAIVGELEADHSAIAADVENRMAAAAQEQVGNPVQPEIVIACHPPLYRIFADLHFIQLFLTFSKKPVDAIQECCMVSHRPRQPRRPNQRKTSMTDLIFTDRNFAATTVTVKAMTEAGATWLAEKLGSSIPVRGATLRKSGAYAMIDAVAASSLHYEVEA
jgi:hypothetical protein